MVLLQSKASFKGYNVYFRPDFPWEPSVLVLRSACHLLAGVPVENYKPPSRPRCCGATVSDATQSGPQDYYSPAT